MICVAKMRLYVIQIGSAMLIDNRRCIKIGYYRHHPNANGNDTKTQYYLAATEEDNFEVSATEVRITHVYSQYC